MKNLRLLTTVTLFSVLWTWTGCAPKVPPHPAPTPVPTTPQETKKNDLASHLVGVWENPGRGGKTKQIIFDPNGKITFQNGLEYFNPGQWDLDVARNELHMIFPNADVDKLQIFKLYVGDGVKAFDHVHKQVTYAFDDQTWSLNVGGWVYSKADKAAQPVPAEAEPVIK